jgi:drug/metabolite transporter (DMT)-like permease
VPLLASSMALSAGVVWSFGAVAARWADSTDAFQYLIWRSVGVIAVVELIGRARRQPGGRTVAAYSSGGLMVLGNVMLLLASIGFVYAVKTTTAANAAFLGSTTPLFGVIVARAFLGERISRVTVAAMGAAFVGLVVMLAGDVEAGNMLGNAGAITAAVGFAGYTACVRSDPHRDWSPVLPGYAAMMIVICGAVTVAGGRTLVPPAHDIALALLHGGVFIVVGTLLFNHASREVPVAAMTVFAQTEMVLVPLWSFVVLSERPKGTTLVGGCIILLAVLGKAVLDARAPAVRALPPAPPLP